MNNQTSADENPRPRTRKLIDDLLHQRQEMLVLLWELSKLDADDADGTLKDLLEDFLEILVDYIASGHFGLYRRIAEGKERRTPVVETAQEIYPRISQTTDIAIDFSDRYEAANSGRLQTHLAQDLSTLGEEVTTRIELEDQLIIAMLGPDYSIPSARPH
ncbi:MAG: Rsd/AlgQ family anti-sigma factor [Gammaproteobacteria bacterium]|jgi:regulator of sigma D